jgi:hypothetical protein
VKPSGKNKNKNKKNKRLLSIEDDDTDEGRMLTMCSKGNKPIRTDATPPKVLA